MLVHEVRPQRSKGKVHISRFYSILDSVFIRREFLHKVVVDYCTDSTVSIHKIYSTYVLYQQTQYQYTAMMMMRSAVTRTAARAAHR
jgi:cytochrome bd-type quinol oxidase subunit 1